MKEDDQPVLPHTSASAAPLKPVKQPRYMPVKSAVLWAIVVSILVLLLTTAGMSAAFLLGKNMKPQDIETKRQTVVQEGDVIADVAQRVGPSVVSIVTEQQATLQSRLYGTRTRTSQAAGTGVIIDTTGYILTNKHVVSEGTSAVSVVTSDGTTYSNVEIIGRDTLNDLAILKVNKPNNFQAVTLGDSEKVRTGQKVIAIGNALGQFQNTVTSGIISGIGRPIAASDENGSASEQLSNLFQTDAAINSGNSGGPLLNFSGEVIGINTAVAANAENIGFSIPINEAKGIIESVKTTGKLTRPFLGVQYVMLDADSARELGLQVKEGAYISKDAGSIVSGSPAEKAGLKPGDVVIAVNKVKLSETTSLASAVGRFKIGDSVELTIIRNDKEQKLKATLVATPAN